MGKRGLEMDSCSGEKQVSDSWIVDELQFFSGFYIESDPLGALIELLFWESQQGKT